MKFIKYITAILLTIFVGWSCEDPADTFDPKNPDLSVDAIRGTINSAQRILDGAERQLSLALNDLLVVTELASDNYTNTATYFNQFVDNLVIDPTDDDIDDSQFNLHRLRELAQVGLEDIGPADPNYTPNQEAEFRFYEGYARLLMAENFKTLPLEPGGPLVSAEVQLDSAVMSFTNGLSVATEDFTRASLYMARARALRLLGDVNKAVADADQVLAIDPEFLRMTRYDAVNGPTNTFQDALFDRGSFDDLQPLPRLDFLDPKYNGSDPTMDIGVPILKAEEAYLIKAEAALPNNNLSGAKTAMINTIDLVKMRPTATFSDKVEGRTQDDPGSRPNTSDIKVKASPDAPARSGLVLNRQAATVTVPTISGTSVTPAMVNAANTVDEALYLVYLMRQEIFIAEGRRMSDLGIRLVVSATEQSLNPSVTPEDQQPVIPPFIEPIRTELDDFTYDPQTKVVTILHDLNQILVDNKTSDLTVPFF